MQPDPASLEEANGRLHKASLDLRAANIDLAAEPPPPEDAAFHAQQAAEKSLEALLTLHDKPIKKTHDLVALGMECAPLDPSLSPLLPRVGTLTTYAWLYRYPGEPEDLSSEDARDAVVLATELFERVRASVGHTPLGSDCR
jgi:HEPN domain-containing protein